MANPAPTINQINAFNATQGTTIDFNIIGGTELVRSNKIYIYDLSDNSLICTHLYVSTESIHELPPNTDGSIVYESGKSSADFVNGKQYYAQIQTFTDIAGTQGGSGLSVSKLFWCLVDPSLTIATIPSSISTTSYNVSATYNANTSVVSNIIQQYQFSLYSATGSLLQSSGVVVGSGTQQGTSTAYDISYNFTGLSVGSSYYVVVDVTTTQGMSVSVQSNTFTVSIDTPTLGEATVVNNACDGYISVTSNLSGEYGGSGSGDIVSFETDSENVFTKLQVDLEPVQDLNGYDAPWVGGSGKNQFPNIVQGTYTNGSVTIIIPANSVINANVGGAGTVNLPLTVPLNLQTGYKMYIGGALKGTIRFYENNTFLDYWTLTGNDRVISESELATLRNHNINSIQIITDGSQTGTFVLRLMIVANSVTDYTYEPYANICPISGHTDVVTHRTGKNLIDESTNESGAIDANGNLTVNANFNRTQLISVSSTIEIRANFNTGYTVRVHGYNSNGQWVQQLQAIVTTGSLQTETIDIPSQIAYVRLSYPIYVGTIALANIVTYTTQLGQTVYGGTLDVVSGLLTVDKAIVDLGTLLWNYGKPFGGANEFFWTSGLSGVAVFPTVVTQTDAICSCFYAKSANEMNSHYSTTDGAFSLFNNWVIVHDNAYTDAATFKTAMTGQTICYELATPQTYQLTPQQIQTLLGQNNVWSEQGDVEVTYNIPITNLLVKRQDVDDVSGDWLTLYSQPVSQASDMDFTFIDFLNQYGKTYKYALVPLLTQTQSGVEVEVEGGYTVSDEVQSIFDGVYIGDSTGVQRLKAGVAYNNLNTNQQVGVIPTLGNKYPIVVSNGNIQYDTGSVSGLIVPDDFYSNGNLSRLDMSDKREAINDFLTNKKPKILKDWNGNIWLVVFTDNVDVSFDNNYGMGIATFTSGWTEVGDPTNQEDLQRTGLINVGGD